MKDFIKFLSGKIYKPAEIPEDYVNRAFVLVCNDTRYHFQNISDEDVYESITSNGDGLPVYLYRLGTLLSHSTFENKLCALKMLHWLMKEVCSCEIYFNNIIGPGFLMVHGEGTIIGSRNTIGKGFIIHQGCTIGHKKNGMGKPSGQGCKIGDNVRMYVNSTIIGELEIGTNVVVGAHTIIMENVPSDSIVLNKFKQEIIQR